VFVSNQREKPRLPDGRGHIFAYIAVSILRGGDKIKRNENTIGDVLQTTYGELHLSLYQMCAVLAKVLT